VWLTNFADQNSIAAAKPKASVDVKPSVENKVSPETQLSLIGEADSQEIVAKFLTILEKSHHFSGVQIKYVEKEENIEPSRFKFEFTVPVTVLTGGGT
jgi:Tfp pilus assembly protein PilN